MATKYRINQDNTVGVKVTSKWLKNNKDLIVNGQLVSEWQTTSKKPSEDLELPIWDGFGWVEGMTDELRQQKYIERANEIETQNYLQRISDGATYYAQVSAKLRLLKLNGGILPEQLTVIENTTRPVRDEVLAGQWKTAKELLEGIGDAVIGQDLYNQFWTDIDNYIKKSYKD